MAFVELYSVTMSTAYVMQAFNLYDSIRLKGIRSLLSGKVVESSPHELQFQLGDHRYLFVYRFGCLVFFNVGAEEIDREIARLKAALGGGLAEPTQESYEIVLSDANRVEFDNVHLKKVSLDYLRLIAMTLGQSSALEYFEIRADQMLAETSNFMRKLSRIGALPLQTRNLFKIIGSTASARQHVISNLSVLDPPKETWKSKELGIFYKDLQQNFDIDVRFRVLDRKLTLIQDNIGIIADLTSSRRTFLVEALIVVLIVLEIVLALSGH